MSKRMCAVIGAFALMCVALPSLAQAPRISVQPDLSNRWFRIRVVNKLDIPIYYKLVGGKGKEYVHQTLRPGDSELEKVTGGDKVLCVWNPDEEVIMASAVFISGSGKIAIGWTAEAPAQGDRAARPARAAAPRIQVEPD